MPSTPVSTPHGHPFLIVIGGLPGSGKTTLAHALSQHLGALHMNTDGVRQEKGLRGKYQPKDKLLVYQILLHQVEEALASGHIVVLDGTFSKEIYRQPIRDLTKKFACPVAWIILWVEDAIAHARVSISRPDSEAGVDVYEKMREEWEPLLETHLLLDSGKEPVSGLLPQCQTWLKALDWKAKSVK